MKRKILMFSLALLLFLTGCGGQPKQTAENLHYHDLYPHGILTEEERELRSALKEIVSESLPEEMKDMERSVILKARSVEITVLFSDEKICQAPDRWDETAEIARGSSADLRESLPEDDERSIVLYFSDPRQILLTAKDGELLYDRFSRKKFESLELETTIDPEAAVSEILEEVYGKLDEVQAGLDGIASGSSSSVVYVSNESNTIHSISNCSGMKNYREMSRSDADDNGYKYCSNCW